MAAGRHLGNFEGIYLWNGLSKPLALDREELNRNMRENNV